MTLPLGERTGAETEATPANHRQWIDHLVKKGAVVVYPRY